MQEEIGQSKEFGQYLRPREATTVIENKEMRDALTNIAKEIHIFNISHTANSTVIQDNKRDSTIKMTIPNLILKKRKFVNLKTSLKIKLRLLTYSKSKNIATLRRNLKHSTVETVSKSILINQLKTLEKLIADEYVNWRNKNNTTTIFDKSVNSKNESLSTQEQLRTMFFNYRQNAFAYNKERIKCEFLEQKNRYLNNKIAILERCLKSTLEALQEHSQKKSEQDTLSFEREKKRHEINKLCWVNLPIKRHLVRVRSVLEDQKDLLTQLKLISKDIALSDFNLTKN